MSSQRIFIAFKAPPGVAAALAEVLMRLRATAPRVRWESPDKFHCTMKFLGSVEIGNTEPIASAVRTMVAGASAFRVTYETIGAFPNRRAPRVVWVGCTEPSGVLAKLRDELEEGLVPFGFEREEKPFKPHITLGRVKDPADAKHLTPMLESLTFEPLTVQVNDIVLMKSDLTPRGSLYTTLQEFPLHR